MEQLKKLYETTELSIEQIARKVDLPFWKVFDFISKNYSKEYRTSRKKKCYRNSKLGNLNPAFNKKGKECLHYVGDISDGKGYILTLKPEWYTGRPGSKHVFKHHIVMCEALKITEIPKGWCVHHINGNKEDNLLINLAFMTTSAHARLHNHDSQR